MKPSSLKQHRDQNVRRRRIWWFPVVCIILVGIGWWMWSTKNPTVHDDVTIVHTLRGFQPKEVWIRPGSTVTFITKSGKAFWPASNIHPFHTLYPEFDPKKPVPPEESWSITIHQSGIWQYHDHIYPYLRGRIVVVDPVTGENPLDCSKLDALQGVDRERCWDILVGDAYEQGGIRGAFAEFDRLYATDELFVTSGCHQQAHRIGEIVYAQYQNHKKIQDVVFPASASSCGYGFFHGLIEHMLRDLPDVAVAREFCEHISGKYEHEMPRIRDNCYHSAGHGFIPDPPPVEQWGDVETIVRTPLEKCAELTQDDRKQQECREGVFNVVASWYAHAYYDMQIDPDDPFALCARMADRNDSLACYYELSMIVHPYAGNDLVAIHDAYVAPIADDEIASMVINAVAAGFMEREIINETHERFIDACYKISPRVQSACIVGISGGFVAHGQPGMEYEKALLFCSSPKLHEEDRRECYRNSIRTFRGIYDQQKYRQVCSLVPADYQSYCSEEYL